VCNFEATREGSEREEIERERERAKIGVPS